MRNRTYGGVRGRKTKVGRKLLRFPPTRFYSLLLLSGKTNNVVKGGLKAQQSHSPGQRPG